MTTQSPILILDNIRSCHNVGSILRTADGAGVSMVYVTGITPYPRLEADSRPEHVVLNNHKQIHKTALGAEETVHIEHFDNALKCIEYLRVRSYAIYALENNCNNTQDLFDFTATQPFALILGSEIEGLKPEILNLCDAVLEIPMHGSKNSLNVSVAAGIAIFKLAHLTTN